MTSSEYPADVATLVSRRVDGDRSLVVHLAAQPGSTAAATGIERLGNHLDVSPEDAERIAVTDPAEGHQFLESAAPGTVLIVERRENQVPEDAWGPLVTLFANARYRGVHAILVTTDVPTLVGRAVNVRVEPTDGGFRCALLEPAAGNPEETREIDLGTL
jgi:hypothetical protein